MDLRKAVTALGGLAATHELYARGATRARLSRAVRDRELIRARQGWYCLPELDDQLIRAVRVGGRLGCVAAARHRGLWVRGIPRLHVVVRQNDVRLRSETDKSLRLSEIVGHSTTVHWRRHASERPLISSALDCLLEMAMCVSPERTVAAADCAIRRGFVTKQEWDASLSLLPQRLSALLMEADGVVESITESVFRFRCARLGFRMRSQVAIAGVGRVDFLIGSKLVVEVDGFEYHSDPDQFEEDRRRDARLAVLGYRVLRFSYKQVFERWHEVRAAISACISRGDHR